MLDTLHDRVSQHNIQVSPAPSAAHAGAVALCGHAAFLRGSEAALAHAARLAPPPLSRRAARQPQLLARAPQVASLYYSHITMERLAKLLALPIDQMETQLTTMVTKKQARSPRRQRRSHCCVAS